MNELLKLKLASIPEKPGCYLWKDKNNQILYIGKAKNLKKRTHQYFNKHQSTKTEKLVKEIYDVDYIIVANEAESLILESNLIKQYKPFFNILLKEGSDNFSYIAITNETNPRILYTKNKHLDAKYYGPFANYKEFNAYELYLLLNRIFPLRKCNQMPKKVCMYYHLKQCLGPCIQKIDPSEYDTIKQQIDEIFNNQAKELIKSLEAKEKAFASKLEFEQAKIYCDYVKQLKHIINDQMVQLKQLNNLDIIAYYEQDNELTIMIFNYVDGKLISKHQNICHSYQDNQEALMSYLVQFYLSHSIPQYVYINLDQENITLLEDIFKFKITCPKKGLYLDLITLAMKNAKEYYLKAKLKQASELNRTVEANEQLRKLLHLEQLHTIDIIDNSNTFLEYPVSAIVRFLDTKPDKKMYRKYNLKTKINASDIYFMQEVMIRKFKHEEQEIPDLLILDGGKPQLLAVKEILEALNKWDQVNVIGLVKNKKHQTEAIITKDFATISIDKHSGLYHYLSNMQNEAHRFAIQFHRKKRDSKISSFLDDIKGIGLKTKQKILEIYPNLYDLKNANIETLKQIVNNQQALNNLISKINQELK